MPSKPRRGGPVPRPSQSAPRYAPPAPSEAAKTSMIRICDNRLRMIRAWHMHYRKYEHVRSLRADLDKQIQYWKFESHFTDHKWYDKLKELVAAVDPENYGSFDPVYAHIGKPKPQYVVF